MNKSSWCKGRFFLISREKPNNFPLTKLRFNNPKQIDEKNPQIPPSKDCNGNTSHKRRRQEVSSTNQKRKRIHSGKKDASSSFFRIPTSCRPKHLNFHTRAARRSNSLFRNITTTREQQITRR